MSDIESDVSEIESDVSEIESEEERDIETAFFYDSTSRNASHHDQFSEYAERSTYMELWIILWHDEYRLESDVDVETTQHSLAEFFYGKGGEEVEYAVEINDTYHLKDQEKWLVKMKVWKTLC
jgi:hypothetical protein